MYLWKLLICIGFCSFLVVLTAADAVHDLALRGKVQFEQQLKKSSTCSKRQLRVRKEWGSLKRTERKAYITAVQCLISRPSKLDRKRYPGARTRYDDFVAVHMNQTLTIHSTGSFLSWHRYFTWAYEQALRTECGFEGTQPYWDFGRWAENPATSPIFDGSDTSMGGNGRKIPHKGNSDIKPAGDGGGCVYSGPFANFTVNLGPVDFASDPPPAPNPRADGFGYNPRCLRRDLSNYLSTRYTKTSDIVNLISNNTDIKSFQDVMQQFGGIHFGAHFTTSGDPGSDFYCSPGDPTFFFLHSQIDRVWHIWQTQDYPHRQQVIAGPTHMNGDGPPQTLEDLIDLGVVAKRRYRIKELVSVVEGPFCYAYS